jgi:hypothetical protein
MSWASVLRADGNLDACAELQTSSSAELHFLPNLYPLVPQMLEELQREIAGLSHDATMLVSRASDSPKALDELKAAVLAQLAQRARAG